MNILVENILLCDEFFNRISLNFKTLVRFKCSTVDYFNMFGLDNIDKYYKTF